MRVTKKKLSQTQTRSEKSKRNIDKKRTRGRHEKEKSRLDR